MERKGTVVALGEDRSSIPSILVQLTTNYNSSSRELTLSRKCNC